MKRILFCGGGSAGHVIPNVAIIEALDGITDNLYLGTDGIEKSICQSNGIEFLEYSAVKLVRGKIFCNLTLPFKLFKCINEAGKILDEVKPDLVFCKGGYACVPAAVAAKKRGVPVITHESDLTAGLANKFIAGKCKKVLTTFPSTARAFGNGIWTGSPMREKIFKGNRVEARTKFGLDMRPTILVLGGGSGSEIINAHIARIAPAVCKNYNILHICGKGRKKDADVYGYKQIEFCDDMGACYACADVAVSRCGSNAAHELIALKIPTLFIPLENKRSRGDQIKNAEYFENAGLCRVLHEKDLTDAALLDGMTALFNDKKLKTALAASAVKCGNERIIKEILATLRVVKN